MRLRSHTKSERELSRSESQNPLFSNSDEEEETLIEQKPEIESARETRYRERAARNATSTPKQVPQEEPFAPFSPIQFVAPRAAGTPFPSSSFPKPFPSSPFPQPKLPSSPFPQSTLPLSFAPHLSKSSENQVAAQPLLESSDEGSVTQANRFAENFSARRSEKIEAALREHEQTKMSGRCNQETPIMGDTSPKRNQYRALGMGEKERGVTFEGVGYNNYRKSKLQSNMSIAKALEGKVKQFSGEEDDLTFVEWLKNITDILAVFHIYPEQAVGLMPLYLTGTAKVKYDTLDSEQKSSWARMSYLMAKKLKNDDQIRNVKRELLTFKMGNLSLADYAKKIKQMVNIACQGQLAYDREKEYVASMIRCLNDDIKYKVERMAVPETFEEAFTLIAKNLRISKEKRKRQRLEIEKINVLMIEDRLEKLEPEKKETKNNDHKQKGQKSQGWPNRGNNNRGGFQNSFRGFRGGRGNSFVFFGGNQWNQNSYRGNRG